MTTTTQVCLSLLVFAITLIVWIRAARQTLRNTDINPNDD